MKNERVHATLLAVVGGFVLYLAWQLLDKYRSGTQEMPDAVFIIAIIVFTLGGIGTIAYAWICYRNGNRAKTEEVNPDHSEKEESKE